MQQRSSEGEQWSNRPQVSGSSPLAATKRHIEIGGRTCNTIGVSYQVLQRVVPTTA